MTFHRADGIGPQNTCQSFDHRIYSMKIQSAVATVAKGDLHYALGRFRTVRSAYGGMRRLTDGRNSVQRNGSSTLFPEANIGGIVKAISEEAVFLGLNLPAHVVTEIDAFARSEPLHANYDPHGPTFNYADVRRGKTPDGRFIVRNYLGHEPREVLTIINWSFASEFSDEERRRLRNHAIDYHYDVGGYNFVYASFYISDTDRYSGAHVMMKRSHNRKPLRMLLGSASASEARVRKQFGIEDAITIEGPAGTGCIQDTSCYPPCNSADPP